MRLWADAFSIVARRWPGLALESYGSLICDTAQKWLWNLADWRVSLAVMPPFWLSIGEQDYGPPEFIIPPDFLGLRRAYLTLISTTNPVHYELKIKSNLELTSTGGWPEFIGYVPELGKLRIFPRPYTSGATYLVQCTYKKKATEITPANFSTAHIPWDDQYFDVILEVLRLKIMEFIGDPDRGTVVYQNGAWQANGQLGRVMVRVQEMAEIEAAEMGTDVIAPVAPFDRL